MIKQRTNVFTKLLFALLFSGAIAFWSFQASAEEWTEAQKEVLEVVDAAWKAHLRGDAEALVDKTADGFLDWWPGDPNPFGKQYFIQKYNLWYAGNKPVTYKLKPVAVNIIGDVASVFYHYKWNGDKSPETISGRQTTVFIKQDNKWKMLSNMGVQCNKPPFCY